MEEDIRANMARQFIDRQGEAMQSGKGVFGNRLERGWAPPTVADVEAVTEENLATSPDGIRGDAR